MRISLVEAHLHNPFIVYPLESLLLTGPKTIGVAFPMKLSALARLTGICIIGILGSLLLTRAARVGPEHVNRSSALGVVAPAGSIINDAISRNVPAATVEQVAVTPTLMNVADIIIQPDRPNFQDDAALETPLTTFQLAARQEAALGQPINPDVQIAEPGPDPGAPLLGVNFDAIDYQETGTNSPPDPEIAVGTAHVIVVVNVAIQVYDKTGNELTTIIPANDFFSANSGCDDEVLYDPNVLYDEEAGRYLIGFDQGPFSLGGGYCLAVSQTNDPTGAWWLYYFGINDNQGWVDFPQAAVADEYIVMAGNVFDYQPAPSTTYVGAKIWAFDKSRLYIGAAVAPEAESLGPNYFTLQPLHLHGAAQGTWPNHGERVYFLADDFDGRHYTLFEWTPGESAAQVNTIDLGQAGFPINVPQNGPGTLQSNDYRILDFEYRNSHGWLTQTVSCNPSGTTANCIRWAQIRIFDGILGRSGVGTYGSSSEHRIFPDLAVNLCNDMVIGYTKSSGSIFPGIWYTGRKAAETSGTLQAEAQLRAGEVAYTSFGSDPSPHRWGDYTGMTIDPNGRTFWYVGEYSKDIPVASKWATYVGSFSYPDCQPLNVVDQIFLPIITEP